jgi:hypothetical protein
VEKEKERTKRMGEAVGGGRASIESEQKVETKQEEGR